MHAVSYRADTPPTVACLVNAQTAAAASEEGDAHHSLPSPACCGSTADPGRPLVSWQACWRKRLQLLDLVCNVLCVCVAPLIRRAVNKRRAQPTDASSSQQGPFWTLHGTCTALQALKTYQAENSQSIAEAFLKSAAPGADMTLIALNLPLVLGGLQKVISRTHAVEQMYARVLLKLQPV